MTIKTYSDLIKLPTYEERLEFLKLAAKVGDQTFGGHRHTNQHFYKSEEWRHIRNQVIIRDGGCDLGVEGYDIYDRILIHHITPITLHDLQYRTALLTDLDNLISTSLYTHNAIHYGTNTTNNPFEVKTRHKNDTCPWRR